MPEHKIANGIAWLWEEVERVATIVSGPLLIISTLLAVIDIFSNNWFDSSMSWLSLVWAIAKGGAISFWIGPAFERMMDAHDAGKKFAWFVLFLALGIIDIQSTLVYGLIAAHISDYGVLAFLNIPQIDWIIEQGVMGFVLIGVHRALVHHKPASLADAPAAAQSQLTPETLALAFTQALASHAASSAVAPVTTQKLVRPTTQPINEESVMLRRGAVAHRAYWPGPIAPLTTEDAGEDDDVYDEYELVSEERPEPPAGVGMTRRTTGGPSSRPRRKDSGKSPVDIAAKKQRLHELLFVDPAKSITSIADALLVSRPTAVKYRDEIRRQLWIECPERRDEFRAAWGQDWSAIV